MNEEVLIALLKDGRAEGLSGLYDLYGKRLLAFCLRYVATKEDAEEIVEDVFVKLWNNRATIREEHSMHSMLFAISHNLIINAYRKKLNAPVYENLDRASHEASQESDGLMKMEYEEFCNKLIHLINQLPHTQRQVVTMSKLNGLKNREIAVALSLSEKTVKNQLSLGMKKLHEQLPLCFSWLALLYLSDVCM